MGLQNATNGGALLNKIFVTNSTYTSGQVPTFGSGVFNPGSGSGGGGTWGSITGTLSNQTDLQTALNAKQNTITTGTTSQYFRGDFSLSTFTTDVRAVDLTGLTSTSGTISSTDNILAAFGKTLKGLADVNTRIDNLTPPNTGFFNGGEAASTSRTLGNTTSQALGFITNNSQRIKITATGQVNVTNGNEYAVPNNYVQAGSLVISGRNNTYGGGTGGWNSNTAQLLLEFSTNTEFAGEISGVGLTSFFYFENNATSPNKRLTIGRDMGSGRTNVLRNASHSFIQANTDFSLSSYGNFASYLTDANKPNISIAGTYPHLFLVSQGATAGSNTTAIKLLTIGSDTTYRHFNMVQRNDGKYYAQVYYEGTEFNPHTNVSNSTGTLQYVMPGYSNSSNLSTGIGVGINIEASSILYNLHVYGTSANNGTIAWGYNNTRTETKSDANSTDRLGKQSGFYQSVSTPSNYFSGADTNTLLIDCRHTDFVTGFQIAGRNDNDILWSRKLGRTWYQLLNTYNGWTRTGNDLSANTSDNKLGTTSAHNMLFMCNNLEVFRLDSSRPRRILIDTTGGYGTASTPSYSFSGNFGEECGMYYKSSGVLSFSTQNNERLQIDGSISINSYLPINIAGSTQELRINGTKVMGTRLASINTISNTATGTEIATAVNAIINRMQTHGQIS